MNEKALLLTGTSEDFAASRLEKMLGFFGVSVARMTLADFFSGDEEKFHLFATAETFLELSSALEKNPAAAKKIRSAFVTAGNNDNALATLAQKISGDAATVTAVKSGATWDVTDALPDFCRAMSGLRIVVADNASAIVFDEKKISATKIIFNGDAVAFAKFEFLGFPIFLSTAGVIDIAAPLAARDFDIRAHLLAAAPAVLFIKWAFAKICWQPPETCACLIIDDPLLRPRYGFLNFERLLDLMERLNFSTSIAFIPWNWNRNSQTTVKLIEQNRNRFSISIHGCDHTGGEYGSRHRSQLTWKSREALARMTRSGLPHDRVMVFPQGVFSEAAMTALKHGAFTGTVNSEVTSADPQPRAISIADYWSVALMNYDAFPIFTRRAPWLGVENFAFDILLGKPCLICVHHNDFHDDSRHIVKFFEQLNRLNAKMRWVNLAEVLRRSFRQREISADTVEMEIFACETRIENFSGQKKIFRCHKRESSPESIKEILVDAKPIQWTAAENEIAFETELNPGEAKTVQIVFNELSDEDFSGEKFSYRLKVMARRRLCEFRDHYVRQKTFST